MTDILEFLKESNAIEGVYDSQSLDDAAKAWDFCISQPKLTGAVIRETHKILMKNQPIPDHDKGRYRNIMVYIGGKPALNAMHIPDEMQKWCHKMARLPSDWKKMHIHYEGIHPWIDGNGRTGRIFLNWHRLRLGLSVLVIKESEKLTYYDWFR